MSGDAFHLLVDLEYTPLTHSESDDIEEIDLIE